MKKIDTLILYITNHSNVIRTKNITLHYSIIQFKKVNKIDLKFLSNQPLDESEYLKTIKQKTKKEILVYIHCITKIFSEHT